MSNNLYITSINSDSGKSGITLGFMELLLRDIRKVGFFRPIINPKQDQIDHDTNLILSHFHLNQTYEETYAVTLDEAKRYINNGKQNVLMEIILNKYQQIADKSEFVLCEGTDFRAGHEAFNFDVDGTIAANLSCPAFIISAAHECAVDEVVSLCHLAVEGLRDKGVDSMGVIVNKAPTENQQTILDELKKNIEIPNTFFYVLPYEPSLDHLSISEVQKHLKATLLYGTADTGTLIDGYVVAAMRCENVLNHIEENNLVVTASDRSDIVLASLACRQSSAFPNISGILLTGGQQPTDSIKQLIEGWSGAPVPILLVEETTYPTVEFLHQLHGTIDPDNPSKIATALGIFEKNVDTAELMAKLISRKSTKITPQMFEYKLIRQAKQNRQHIVLPEGLSDRVLQAADILLRRDVCEITLLGDNMEISKAISRLGLDLKNAHIVNPTESALFEEYSTEFYEMRKAKGVNMDMARDVMADATYFGTMMVQKGHADGMVSGSINTTAHTIRPAFQIIKTIPGSSIVSSVFLMCLKDRVLAFGDCAVNPNPTAAELSEIATVSADTAKLFGIDPRVALLSYSTGTSGKGADVDKVIEATRLAKEKCPDLLIEGPIQYDAAIDPSVARTKLPDSKVAGQATVFIFPDLNTGNNTYKAVQRSSEDSLAIGPILQGLRKPVNDLSRGCTVPDIVNTVAITAIQAYASKGDK